MKTFLAIFIIIFLFSIVAFAQRENKTGGRGQESGSIERINRNHVNNRIIDTHPGTIKRQQNLIQETIQLEATDIVYIEPHQQGYCIVKKPDKYNFPDRIYKTPYIEPVLQYFFIGDFYAAIQLLNYLIEENPFVPELHFLRGVAYIKRESDFKKPDYSEADYDFTTVKILDPNFPGLKHYLELLDFYLYGKRPIVIYTTR